MKPFNVKLAAMIYIGWGAALVVLSICSVLSNNNWLWTATWCMLLSHLLFGDRYAAKIKTELKCRQDMLDAIDEADLPDDDDE